MSWTSPTVLIAGLIALLVIITAALKRTGGHAPGWRVRCLSRGHTRPAEDAGIVRVGGASWRKYTLGRCSHCEGLRFIAVEPDPDAEGEPGSNHAV